MKLASLVLVVGALLMAQGALAQEAVYAAPEAPVRERGGVREQRSTIRDTSDQDRPMTASAMMYVPWIYGIGVGAKFGFEIPVAPKGFIPKLNDSVSIEPSLSLGYTRWYGNIGRQDSLHGALILPAVSGLWSFHLKPDLRVYGAVNLGVNVYALKFENERDTRARPYIELAGGLFWKFAEQWALRAELGWFGPRAGVSFLL